MTPVWADDRLPRSTRLLAHLVAAHGRPGAAAQLDALASGAPSPALELYPDRILAQDYTGVPMLADLASGRDVAVAQGAAPGAVDLSVPVDLVVDHSLSVDVAGRPGAAAANVAREYARNDERYRFLRWAEQAFPGLRVWPPGSGICHQLNLERLARVVVTGADGRPRPELVVGCDSHTTMVNALGVLGWGVGGLEAEAVAVGEPLVLPVPEVVGVRLSGRLPEGATATDLALALAERLRAAGVVGSFVELFGPGVGALPLAARATVANMAPEFGSTVALFPVDGETLRYLRLTGRPAAAVAAVEAHAQELGLWHEPEWEGAYGRVVDLDLSSVEAAVAGPSQPHQRVGLSGVRARHAAWSAERGRPEGPLPAGAVAVAAITSCTNTSNPEAMVAAGLLARRAVAAGLRPPKWVKASLAPGSPSVSRYLDRLGLTPALDALGFNLVGYGCTTCDGNSGPLAPAAAGAVEAGADVVAVLSGNRNFPGRVHPAIAATYLASPALVVAYALAGSVAVDLTSEPVGRNGRGPVFLRDVWPDDDEVAAAVRSAVTADVFADEPVALARWEDVPGPTGDHFPWDERSTYLRRSPFAAPRDGAGADVRGARILLWLGDGVTTDHISPVGAIDPAGPAGAWLAARGEAPGSFNSYGSRRGNHEVMVRGGFAHPALGNRLAGDDGPVTVHHPSGEVLAVFDAAARYRDDGVPLVVLAGRGYGAGSSRDWAAKAPALLGVRAVLAQGFERIHRANLVACGVLPVELPPGFDPAAAGVTGAEVVAVTGVDAALDGGAPVMVSIGAVTVAARLCVESAREADALRGGGLLPYALGRRAGVPA